MAQITVLDWMKSMNDYNINDVSLITIALGRGIDDAKKDLYEDLSIKQQELILADILRRTVLFSPSNTASKTVSHAGYSESTGSISDTYRHEKLKWINEIYKKYDDPFYMSDSSRITVQNPFSAKR